MKGLRLLERFLLLAVLVLLPLMAATMGVAVLAGVPWLVRLAGLVYGYVLAEVLVVLTMAMCMRWALTILGTVGGGTEGGAGASGLQPKP